MPEQKKVLFSGKISNGIEFTAAGQPSQVLCCDVLCLRAA